MHNFKFISIFISEYVLYFVCTVSTVLRVLYKDFGSRKEKKKKNPSPQPKPIFYYYYLLFYELFSYYSVLRILGKGDGFFFLF